MKAFVILIGLILCFSLKAQSFSKDSILHSFQSITEKEWTSYSHENYKITYPKSWGLDTSGQLGTHFLVLSPNENPTDSFKESINLVLEDLTGLNIDLNEYIELSKEQIGKLFTNSSFIHKEIMNKNGSTIGKIIYQGDLGIYKLKFEVYVFIKSNHAYILTFTALQATYERYQQIGEKILNSFEFLN